MTAADITRDNDVVTARRPAFPRALLVRAGLLVLGAAIAVYAAQWWTVGRYLESTDDAYVGGDITVMAPKVAGLIAEVPIVDNQLVHAGDLLVKLDARDYQAMVAKTEANIAEQRATIANLQAQLNLQGAVIEQTKASIAAAQAEIIRTRDDYERYKALSKMAVVPAQTLQKSDSDYKQAVAAGDKAKASQDAAERQLEVISTQEQRVEASLAAAQAENAVARLNVEYTELRAPIDGTVGNRSARVGSYAVIGSQLVSIVPSHGLWVDANFKEGQLAHMRVGQPVSIRADILSGHVFHGRLASLAPATGAQFSVLPPENATGNFTKIVQRVPVRIVLDEDAMSGALRPGLSVIAEVDQRGEAGDGREQ